MTQDRNYAFVKALRAVLSATMVLLTSGNALADGGVVVKGSVFGGGNQAGVQVNTEVNISTGQVDGNVYGGGNVGSVGTYTTSEDMKDFTFTENTGECKVTIEGDAIIGTGVSMSADGTFTNGNVYGAGKGEADTYWCEKAMAYKTNVTINAGTIKGTVYGGGKIGRVENDATVTIGAASPADNSLTPTIAGNVFGAGAGLATHGYSALLRGDTKVTVQGYAQVGLSVYGGGEKASVGKFKIVGGLPSEPADDGSGDCTVNVLGSAVIGTNTDNNITDKGNVFGTCQGVAAPASWTTAYDPAYKSMQAVAQKDPAELGTEGTAWEYVAGSDNKYFWEYYADAAAYQGFLNTLALASHPVVTIGGTWNGTTVTPLGTPTVKGSVFGGGQMGITLGTVAVNIAGGTVEDDVYGGGALADTNKGNKTAEQYDVATVTVGTTVVTGMYERSGEAENYVYTVTEDTNAQEGKTYYTRASQSSINTTTVNLTGGIIKGDAYGGGLGQKNGFNNATSDVAAVVWGDISVNLGSNGGSTATAFYITYDNAGTAEAPVNVEKSGRVFGCNNLLGSPQGNVTVTVWNTVNGYKSDGTAIPKTTEENKSSTTESDHSYRLSAVYGGGNLAPYTAAGKKAHVIIHGCSDTSILTVYGGGNAAAVPETQVDVYSAYEIGALFGGGNGKDKYKNDNGWQTNLGADVNGNTNTMIYGGTVHEAYGASNEKGTIYGNVAIDLGVNQSGEICTLDVAKLVGAGKNADVNGDLILTMGCKSSEKIPLVYGGADNANVNGNVELTITSGNFGQVFGGNNETGAIMGHIILNIEETGNCGTPIRIDELYLGGNYAAYSQYGYYYVESTNSAGKPILKPRTAEMADPTAEGYKPAVTPDEYGSAIRNRIPYDPPVLNIISCTSIGKVFGGGLGETAAMYADPTVNINQIFGNTNGVASTTLGAIGGGYTANNQPVEGGVFGGGNKATVYGNTTINIGTLTEVDPVTTPTHLTANANGKYDVLGANIVGNVYGGGNLADVTGNTFVNVCAVKNGTTYSSVTPGSIGVTIAGNVFGGGKGEADDFFCAKAMVGINDAGADAVHYPNYSDGNTTIVIGNGTVNGTVYGGGEIGRVEMNTTVTIGIGAGDETVTSSSSAPVITGSVFGGGKGEEEHGYAALVRGNPTVTVEGNAKIGHSVYGGGEIASVARYNVPRTEDAVQAAILEGYTDAKLGMPYALKDPSSGTCRVTVQGYAEIGPDGMQMTKDGGPDDTGYVFGAGKGILPGGTYAFTQGTTKRMVVYDAKDHTNENQGTKWQWVDYPNHSESNKNVWEYFADLDEYIRFIQTLALSSRTYVTIDGNALVKGSVYGGSENGIVQFNTDVKIQGGQIGVAASGSTECASWTYEAPYAPYDPYAIYKNPEDNKYYYDYAYTQYAEGGAVVATDGHTYYGNVFGGGSGSVPYFDTTKGQSVYLHSAGQVKGDTHVTISGGHILTNVYGGCEATNVSGDAYVTMTNGTVGVPRTDAQIIAHPVTGYIFGAGKGDQRVFFNKDTNVENAVVTIEGGTVYGSVYGGGEDGHVLKDVTMTIGKASDHSGPTIGTSGTSYYDGNVFGGGRGFGGEALTAGNVSGTVTLNIEGGTMLGSVYGGGRLASVGYGLYLTTETGFGENRDDGYGVMQEDGYSDWTKGENDVYSRTAITGFQRGYITVNMNGGTIGNDVENAQYGGNVFGGSMGSLKKQDGTTDNDLWNLLATAKKTTVNVSGGTIKRSVYGGGEMGTVTTDAVVTVSGGTIGSQGNGGVEFGNVYGGGKGYVDPAGSNYITAGIIKGNTDVTISQAENKTTTIYHNIYGGGAYGSVGTFTYDANNVITGHTDDTGIARVTITGGTIGTTGQNNGMVFGSSRGDVGAPGEIHDKLAWVYDTHVTIGDANVGPAIKGSIYGSGENGHTYHDAEVIIHNGTIGIEDEEYAYRGNVYGGGCGTDKYYSDPDNLQENQSLTDGMGDKYNYLAGIVLGDATVTIDGGTVIRNVYGAGAMGSVGTITNYDDLDDKDENNNYLYKHDTSTEDGKTFYDFGLSWPYKFTYGNNTGLTTISITGGAAIGGHVFGAARGAVSVGENDITKQRYDEVKLANVRETQVTIGTANGTQPTIGGSVYGGGEDGHVYENTAITINGGAIAHSVFGGGKGESTFTTTLWDKDNQGNDKTTGAEAVHSWIAGKVFGNTTVTMNGGSVGYFIYGGGNLASVGKGNYSGGADDYSTAGYGELPPENAQNLWTGATTEGTYPYYFANSGITTVNVYGGTLGPTSGTGVDADGLPYGSVFGGSRGKAAASVQLSPRYRYVPDFFLGYVNKTIINIGDATNTTEGYNGPTIHGSVYGGGQDGHVRNSTTVNINKGNICGQGDNEGRSGHVFGAGSGIGTYTDGTSQKCNNSSGSVTCTTLVDVKGGSIAGFVYGGGAMASVGPPKTPEQDYIENKTATDTKKSYSYTKVVVEGGTIGGDVYGASRGPSSSFLSSKFSDDSYDQDKYATVIWSEVLMQGTTAVVNGSVYGGGEGGRVKKDTKVDLLGGTIKGDAYGGGKGALGTDGTVNGTNAIAANVGGDVVVNLGKANNDGSPDLTSPATAFCNTNYTEEGHTHVVKSGRIFGCNNLNGSPQGNVTVTINKTVGGNKTRTAPADLKNANATHNYEVAAVYGGGNLAAYAPTAEGAKLKVLINSCYVSIDEVYGGGNAALVPATDVEVKGAYEINQVFGGGNGADEYTLNGTDWIENPGANITGNTNTILKGGLIHEAYGGSNEKGEIGGDIVIDTGSGGLCSLDLEKMVGAGKNADVNGNLIVVLGCKPGDKIPLYYAGADNANVNGNVELTITSGNFGKVFGGNNEGGAIRGHIIVNIEETGECETPITIDELYLGGNNAAYSRYGYYIKTSNEGGVGAPGETAVLTDGRLTFMPRTSKDDQHKVVKTYNRADNSWTVYTGEEGDVPPLYDEPVLNVVSCTSIGEVYGGGYGTGGTMYANPTVNINMIPGHFADDNNVGVPKVMDDLNIPDTDNPSHLGIIGDVFGGGNAAAVIGNPTVNIGTATEQIRLHLRYDKNNITETSDGYEYSEPKTVLGAYIHGNVYGGGNLADVGYLHDDTKNPDPDAIYCNTNVNICSKEVTENSETVWQSVAVGSGGVTIVGDVYGGGKGKENTFKCEKAMIVGSTNVRIGNGTMRRDVFGGGEVGRVEQNTSVTVGLTSGTSAPVINGNVFGAGAGKATHGYSALVRGDATVTVQAGTKVGGSVYGGGEIATAGRYVVVDGLPTQTTAGGLCTVTVQGDAEITGNVFGAGMGVTPAYDGTNYKNFKSMLPVANKPSGDEGDTWDYYVDEDNQKDEHFVWKYYKTEAAYLTFLQSLALASNTRVTIDGDAKVKKNVYGGSESGFVQDHTQVTTQGSCVIGTVTTGDNPTVTDGNVFGGGKGLASFAEAGLVKGTTTLYINNGTMYGNVYGGGELGSVGKYVVSSDMRNFYWTDNPIANIDPNDSSTFPYNNTGVCTVNIAGGTIGNTGVAMASDGTFANGNVFGAGKGLEDTFWCEKAIVYKANVNITAGTVNGNVYGGGEVGRVETDAVVKIGPDTGTSTPHIIGNVFGGGAGVKTHGYSALARGNTYVTVQSSAQVGHNVYGGGQIAAVGKYYLVTADNVADHPGLSVGMPYSLVNDALGICNVTVKGDAVITGNVFGGGKGKEPENLDFEAPSGSDYHTTSYDIDDHMPKRMMNDYAGKNTYCEYYNPPTNSIIWEYFDTKEKYETFLETLGLTTQSRVNIEGSAQVNGNVYGGSESGFVQHNTSVTIAGGTIGTTTTGGNVFGGGLGLATFAEAGRVRGNASVTVQNGHVLGNVYGGGSLGDVGTIDKRDKVKYNYMWTNQVDPVPNPEDPTSYTWNETGVCNVTINGGEIGTGVGPSADGTYTNGNVFGAGKGLEDTWWCEKAIAYKTNVTITDGTIKGTVYGGGQVGRVENNSVVTIGTADESEGTSKPNITGNVFGAGAGVMTHGYSALVRGDASVTVQGIALVGGSVYGGGEIASVGRFTVVGGLPKHPDSGGTCTVNIIGHAKIGAGGTGHNVFGACKGVTPAYSNDPADPNRSKSMQLIGNAPENHPELWTHYNNDPNSPFIWRYYPNEAAYLDFLETLALTSHPIVTIGGTWNETTETVTPSGTPTVNGSVFGGGERGITLGSVNVNMNGGEVTQDVYGGGSLANTNKGNWDDNKWADGKYNASTHATEYQTNVNLAGGTIGGNVYGGGLGRQHQDAVAAQPAQGTEGEPGYVPAVPAQEEMAAIAAKVYGDVTVKLNQNEGDCVVKGSIFGCNNLNGSPQSAVTVHVYKTVQKNNEGTVIDKPVKNSGNYELTAVYGGGNLAAFSPDLVATCDTVRARIIIDGCYQTSIKTVYGGGNAASTPATEVTVNSTYEIEELFGGGNGYGYMDAANTIPNPGANVGYRPYPTELDPPASSVDERAEYGYGSGEAAVNIYGGRIHRIFGGSNTKGNVRKTAVTILDSQDLCDLSIDEAYGGGKSAPMDAEAKLLMACIPGLKAAYGGAQDADIQNDVVLSITNGTFDRVFGGNNISGTIRGTITVNIEETGCKPVIIGQLYGGGNMAPYIAPAGKPGPTVNVKSFTSIGDIYGGGYGETAVVNGDTYVNINVVEGKYASDNVAVIAENKAVKDGAIVEKTESGYPAGSYPVPSHATGKIGAINNVFGGGNAAEVKGNTNVNIGTVAEGYVVKTIAENASVAGLYTRSGAGTTASPYVYTPTGAENFAVAGTTYYEKKAVGADIRGNVYGGGNEAEVSGDTNVNIGRKAQ